MTNEELIKIAWTRELTDERVAIAAAYWLDCSPHERTEADGIILARYARAAMEEIKLRKMYGGFLQSVIRSGEKWEGAFDDFKKTLSGGSTHENE